MKNTRHRTTLATALALFGALGVSACGLFGGVFNPPPPVTPPVPQQVSLLDQGSKWDQANRAAFYTQDQGSRIMPLSWFTALRRADGSAFLSDRLQRYGYLPNPASTRGLPVRNSTDNSGCF